MFTLFFLFIDGIVYNLIVSIYSVFDFLTKLNIFDDERYSEITHNIYIILGLIMLFVLSYALLKAVINPDEFAKGEKSFPNLVKNIIISLALIAVMPTIFSFAMSFQASILNNNTIYKFILDSEGVDDIADADPGRALAFYTFTSFMYPSEEFCTDGKGSMTVDQAEECKNDIESDGSLFKPSTWFGRNRITLKEADDLVLSGQASFVYYSEFADSINENKISYTMFVSTIVGIFIAYVLINFCFDVALRVIKLAFYQLIAPVAIICRIIPGGKTKDVFDKWVKQTISVYIEVFVRIATMALGVFLLKIVIEEFNSGIPGIGQLGFLGKMSVRVLLIMGVVIFIRQAPKLIGDIFGLDTGGMKLGIMDKLAMGGALTAGATIGGGVSMLTKNAVAAGKNFKATKGQGFKTRAGSLLGGTLSTIAGTVSGTARAGYYARNTKNFKDAKEATSKAVSEATTARNYRAKYKASHGGNLKGVITGHASDTLAHAKEWLGIGNSLEGYKEEKDFYGKITAIDDSSDSVATDLLGRDAISQSTALMEKASANKIHMSLDAMRERIESARKENVGNMIGRNVTDFFGNSQTINNENDYAVYLASLKSQVSGAERDMKKFLKTEGYKGTSGVSNINGIIAADGLSLGGGELQRMAKLKSDRDNIENLVTENQAMISQLNSNLAAGTTQINAINDGNVNGIIGAWEQTDQLVNNVKNRIIDINSEVERLTREKERHGGNQNNSK